MSLSKIEMMYLILLWVKNKGTDKGNYLLEAICEQNQPQLFKDTLEEAKECGYLKNVIVLHEDDLGYPQVNATITLKGKKYIEANSPIAKTWKLIKGFVTPKK